MGEASNEDVAAGRQAEALREDMEQTREQIGETLEAIGEKLSPGNMVQEAADTVRAAASRTMGNVMNTASERASELAGQARDTVDAVRRRVGDNPVPAALTAIVLGWVAYKAMTRRGSSVRPYNARWRDMPEPGAEDWTNDYGYTESMRDRMNATADRVSSTTREAAGQVARIFRQNPLAFGVAALAVVAGLSFTLEYEPLLGALR